MSNTDALRADYVCPETGELRPERRKFARVPDEEVEHLFNGFHNAIGNAIGNADAYSVGYLRAMRDAFAKYVRRAALAEKEPADQGDQAQALRGGEEPPGWRPIETAPKDGTPILVWSSDRGASWIAKYQPVYESGYRPENPWFSLMLNCRWHPNNGASFAPTHWMPVPRFVPTDETAGQISK